MMRILLLAALSTLTLFFGFASSASGVPKPQLVDGTPYPEDSVGVGRATTQSSSHGGALTGDALNEGGFGINHPPTGYTLEATLPLGNVDSRVEVALQEPLYSEKQNGEQPLDLRPIADKPGIYGIKTTIIGISLAALGLYLLYRASSGLQGLVVNPDGGPSSYFVMGAKFGASNAENMVGIFSTAVGFCLLLSGGFSLLMSLVRRMRASKGHETKLKPSIRGIVLIAILPLYALLLFWRPIFGKVSWANSDYEKNLVRISAAAAAGIGLLLISILQRSNYNRKLAKATASLVA